jgi:hypothetical protein
MANYELFPTQNLNCEVTTSDVSFDFGDTSRFRKIKFPEQAGITANALLQLVPAQLVADTASNLYVLHFPKGIQGALMNLHQGGQSTTMIDAAGSFAGSASLYKVNPTAVAAFQMFSVASFATGQYFLADISSKLTEVNRKLDDLLAFLQASKRTELLSELTFVKYALANYATIMLSEPQRMATIGNLQRAKIKAVADIEFYTEQLESSAAAKSNENQAKTVLQNKQGIDLASQLYAISTIMEAYYSQNWNQSYLANISADAKPLFALTQNRMISAITKFSDRINKDLESKKKGLLKGDVSQSEHKVLKLYDTLNSQSETPLLAFIEEALDKPSEPSELYLRSDGSVYQKI